MMAGKAYWAGRCMGQQPEQSENSEVGVTLRLNGSVATRSPYLTGDVRDTGLSNHISNALQSSGAGVHRVQSITIISSYLRAKWPGCPCWGEDLLAELPAKEEP